MEYAESCKELWEAVGGGALPWTQLVVACGSCASRAADAAIPFFFLFGQGGVCGELQGAVGGSGGGLPGREPLLLHGTPRVSTVLMQGCTCTIDLYSCRAVLAQDGLYCLSVACHGTPQVRTVLRLYKTARNRILTLAMVLAQNWTV